MSSRKEYNLQKGLQAKQLNDDVAKPLSPRSSATRSTNNAKEVARIRETCPPGTSDERIALILQQTKGDAGKVQLAVSELWENHGAVQDEWATVSKKQPKKKNDDKTSWTTPTQQHKNTYQHGGDNSTLQTGGRGRGNTRGPASGGRGTTRDGTTRDASRGGRGGGRGTGRGQDNWVRQEEHAAGDTTDQTADERDNTPASGTHKTETKQTKQPATPKHDTSAPVAPAPVLHGAWAKKPNILNQAKPASPKKAAAPPTQTQPPATQVAMPQSPKKQATTPQWDVSKDTKLEDTTPPASTPSTTAWPAATNAASSTEAQKWPRSPNQKKDDKPEPTTRVEPADTIASWGASLESSKAQTPAASSSSDWDTAAPAWTRSSPILTPSFQHPASSPKAAVFSPKATKSPKSPTQTKGHDRSFPSSPTNAAPATEVRQNKFSMGRWGDVAAPELSLQFGSFSMDIDNTTTASANWANTATTPATASWSPKKSHEQAAPAVKSPRATSSAPPGLTESPKHAASPRKFQNPAPNAPSPAALPKPEEVSKRQQGPASSRAAQQTPYNAPSAGTPAGQSKLNHPTSSAAFTSSPLYQNHPSTYNQYSVGMSGRSQQPSAATSTAQPTTPSSAASGHVQGAIGKQTNANRNQTQSNAGGINQGNAPSTNAGAGSSNPQTSGPAPNVNPNQGAHQQQPHLAPYQQLPHAYHPQYAPPPPPGMAMPYNPYNYNPQYYPQQGYPHGYYQNHQYPQYSPRQFPPRGNIPYGMDGAPGFSNPPNVPLGYQDPSHLGHPNDYGPGFGDLGYGQLHPQVPPHHLQQGGGKPQAPLSNGRPIDPTYTVGPSREHTASPPVPGNPNPAVYGQQQHYSNWAGSYNQPPQQQQPLGGWGGHQQQQQPPPHHHQQQGYPQHQQSYRPYNNGGANDAGNQGGWSS
ncbi:hypothetical protein H310_03646 [Aphanomyces invadans]|uniref:Uncharacterized protein n=1 Tax=Aphanomyces invadans TaxID=157072 RepID=A0A024UKB4_9STRA|nr:hypothetical protein H310_03646 [Aphanomyces invadans]ETW06048.1 hypothetical protein H310_03646 [Aphanomyces invadans]|eukprot:XP_008865825.1 hypothetical protein H310_03646 [Aphanomyces invadans]